MEEPKVETMAQASESVTKAKKTTTVELADGTEVVVRKLSWMHFTELWGRLGMLVASWLKLQSGEELDDEAIAKAIMEVPGLAVEFITYTTEYSERDVQKFDDYADVFRIVSASIAHNKPGEALGFFAAISGLSASDKTA